MTLLLLSAIPTSSVGVLLISRETYAMFYASLGLTLTFLSVIVAYLAMFYAVAGAAKGGSDWYEVMVYCCNIIGVAGVCC